MWNCNIFSTTYLNMLLNFTQCNVSAKYNLAILQFNVSDKHLACYDSVDSMYTNICLASNPFKMPAEYMPERHWSQYVCKSPSGNSWLPCVCYVFVWQWKIIELYLLSAFLANAELQHIWYYLSEYVFEHHSIQCVYKIWFDNTSVQWVERVWCDCSPRSNAVRRSFQKNVYGKSLSTLAMNRKVLKAQTRCQFILSPSWSRRCAQCLLWAKDGKTLWSRMLQMHLPDGTIANESRDVRWKSRQTCSQVVIDWRPSFCATLQTATMNLRVCSHRWKGLVVDSKIMALKLRCA